MSDPHSVYGAADRIIIAGYLDVHPDDRDACVAAATDMQMATRNDEPGCLAYSFSADPCVPGRIQVYELWTDTASLAAHFQHPNYFGMREMLGTFRRVGGSIAKYRSDLSEPVYDQDRKARADFFTA
jgi:quinol monooxygenase YgiN